MYKSGFRWLLTFIFVLGLLITPASLASAAAVKGQPAMLLAATGDGSPSDSNIKYIGRWDTSDSTNFKSYWSGAYFRVNFTGTSLSIKLGATVPIYVTIDGVTKYYSAANGTVNLASSGLASGTHTLRVAARSEYDTIQFKGLVLSSGASTQAPAAKSKLIEFVGDSITAGCCTLSSWALSDYAWLAGEALNADHTQIAYSGICLQNAANCGENNIGMGVQFFKLQTIRYTNSPMWDFNRYQPNQVVINLGTNDWNTSDSTLQSTYITFLQNVRAKYPNAEIFVLRTFGGYKAALTKAAVTARNSAGDSKIRYVDTTGWVTTGDFDSDNLHPNTNGHVKIANRLQSVLGTALPPTSTPTRTSTPNIPTNTPSGPTATPGTGPISINAGGSATGSFTTDQYFSGGTAYTTTNTIDTSLVGSVPAAVFQSERYGAFSYTIPRVAGSAQTVTLYFAETYLTAAGQRLFNVTINGTTVLSSFDIYASAGGQNKAISRTFNTTANSSGQVVIQFVTGTENPKVNGIMVASAAGPTNTPTKTFTPSVPTNTPVGPTNTPVVPTNTPTQGSGGGSCSPVTSTITVPFSFDGAGTLCWQSTNLGSYINSWNTTSVTINGVNATNIYLAAGSYPAKIGGYWYVSYASGVAWSHFEAK